MNTMESIPAPGREGPRSRRRRWLVALVATGLVLLIVGLALRARGKSGSQATRDRLRAAGYPLTLQELDRWYVSVPDPENAALGIIEGTGDLPELKGSSLPFVGGGKAPPRGEKWDSDLIREAREFQAANRGALARLSRAAGLPASRYPVALTNGFNSILSYLPAAKRASQVLALEAAVHSEAGDGEAAARSVAAILGVARSLENEPVLISQLVRIAIESSGVSVTERLVNRVALPDASLAELQVALLRAATNRGLERGLAGEACMGLNFFEMPPAKLAQTWGSPGGGGAGTAQPGASPLQHVMATVYSVAGLKAEDERFFLHMMEQMIGAARRDLWESEAILKGLEPELIVAKTHWYRGRIFSSMLLPALLKAHARDARSRASLRCAATALAVERFRRAQDGRLPQNLEELVPGFLPAPQIDPFTGKELNFHPHGGGFVIYSFGPDKDDDGGTEFRPGASQGDDYDVTFTVER